MEIIGNSNYLANLYLEVRSKLINFCERHNLNHTVKLKNNKLVIECQKRD